MSEGIPVKMFIPDWDGLGKVLYFNSKHNADHHPIIDYNILEGDEEVNS